MKNVVLILIAVIALWFLISRMNREPQAADNSAVQYAENLKQSEDKAAEAAAKANLAIARAALSRFKNSEGRIPNSLQEMVDLNYLDRVPQFVKYDEKSGSFEKEIK